MKKSRRVRADVHSMPGAAGRLALILAAAPVVLLAILQVASPEFDPSWRMVSEYALGRYPWLLSLLFLSWGISTWALAAALRPHLSTRAGRLGIVFLVVAGLGEAMASVFDITQDLPHGIAGLLGVLGLPVAAVLVSAALPRTRSWATARRPLITLAGLTWLAVATLVASLVLMTIQVAQAYGGQLPQAAPATLPPGVFKLAGWADRLIVVSNCLWAAALAWRVAGVARARSPQVGATGAAVRATPAPASTAS